MRWKELLFTGFYTGYSPVAPGTAGTLVALLIYLIEYACFGKFVWLSNLIIVLFMIYPSVKIADSGELFFAEKDPQQVVLDEIMGFWISVLFFPFNWKIIILAFILFRLYDIIKPFPIAKFENIKGGLGIMLDDFVSGIYTNLTILLVAKFFNFL